MQRLGTGKNCAGRCRPRGQFVGCSAALGRRCRGLVASGCRRFGQPKGGARGPGRPSATANGERGSPRLVVEGDTVSLHYTCRGPDGEVLDSSRERGEPVTFEVGAGDVIGNRLFQGFDGAVRGVGKGEMVVLEAQGGEWKKDLLFTVPREHQEILRLEGRYKNHGGLKEGMVVELANGGMAMVVEMTEGEIKLDANNMMAGRNLTFELEVVDIFQE